MFLVKNSKSANYQIIYEVNGKRTSRSTGTSNKAEAQKIFAVFEKTFSQLEREKNTSVAKSSTPSLEEFKKQYLDYCKPLMSKHYISSIELSFKQFIALVGDISLSSINSQMVDNFVSITFARTSRGASQYFRTLKAAVNKAVEWRHIETNPFIKIKFPRLPKVYPAYLTEDELLIIVSKTKHQHLKDLYMCAFYTGMRLGELINMKWDWVDFFNDLITVKCDSNFLTKSKKERKIPMNNKVRSIVTRRFQSAPHQPNEVVFYRVKGRRLHDETISKQFKDLAMLSGVNERIHFHSLRHSFASNLAQKGVSLYIVKELLGHEDIATTQIYSHLQQQNLRDAVKLL